MNKSIHQAFPIVFPALLWRRTEGELLCDWMGGLPISDVSGAPPRPAHRGGRLGPALGPSLPGLFSSGGPAPTAPRAALALQPLLLLRAQVGERRVRGCGVGAPGRGDPESRGGGRVPGARPGRGWRAWRDPREPQDSPRVLQQRGARPGGNPQFLEPWKDVAEAVSTCPEGTDSAPHPEHPEHPDPGPVSAGHPPPRPRRCPALGESWAGGSPRPPLPGPLGSGSVGTARGWQSGRRGRRPEPSFLSTWT